MASSHFQEGSHHCAMFHGNDHGATDKNFRKCKLHPGHKEFMTIDEFEKNPPSQINLTEEDMHRFKNTSDRTVRVVVSHISVDRPDTFKHSKTPYPCIEKRGSFHWIRYGTAYLVKRCSFEMKDACPCPECKSSTCQIPSRTSDFFVLKTATHVIFDQQEAQNAIFDFFYDVEDRENVRHVYGVTVRGSHVLRLETDRCFVVAVTHDRYLAEKLDILCDVNEQSLKGILLSHPHGVSKRISAGDHLPSKLVAIPNKTSIKLKRDTMVRFPGCQDAGYARDIIRLHTYNKPLRTSDYHRLSETLVLCRELTIFCPEGIVMEADQEPWDLFSRDNKNAWFRLAPGTQVITKNGKRYTLPYKDDEVRDERMEVFGSIKSFGEKNYNDKIRLFFYSSYNIAACPGSSGAHVRFHEIESWFSKTANVHFGHSEGHSTSSMICLTAPD